MKFAVIKTGGKQYKVSEGDSLKIEKVSARGGTASGGKVEMKEGDKVAFDEVLLVDDGKKTEVGTPTIKSSKVEATIEKIGKAKKVIVAKFKSKSRYSVKRGHRQPYFQVKINSIK
jgi:large subunit ribosomal protein L21